MKKFLNLGCGANWKELYPEYQGVDIIDYGQHYVGDVLKVLPVLSESFYDEIMANHFLEHFSPKELKLIFSGVYKLLVVGGIFKFVVPHMKKERAWILSHQTFWNETTIRWLGEKEANTVYGFGSWSIKEVVTNDRDDIHAWLVKK